MERSEFARSCRAQALGWPEETSLLDDLVNASAVQSTTSDPVGVRASDVH